MSGPHPAPLRQNRDFCWLMTGQTLSLAGKGISGFASPLIVFAVTGSTTKAGFVSAATALGGVATLLPSGVIADRYNRKTILKATALAGLAIYLSLAVAGFLHHLTFLHLLIAGVAAGISSALFNPAEASAVREVVEVDQLPAAMSVMQGRGFAATLLSGPLGGVLFGISRFVPYSLNAFGYLAVFLATLRVRSRLAPASGARDRSPLHDLVEGLVYTWRNISIRAVILAVSLLNFASVGMLLLVNLHLFSTGHSAFEVGIVDSAAGVGGLVGAAIAPRLVRRFPAGLLGILLILVFTAALTGLTFSNYVGVVVLSLVLAAPVPVFDAALVGYATAITPMRLQARMATAAGFTVSVMVPFAPAIAGWGLRGAGYPTTGAIFVGACVAGLLGLGLSRSVRRIPSSQHWADDILPDERARPDDGVIPAAN